MDDVQLRDEAVRDRIRLAEEFLDPSMSPVQIAMAAYRADFLRRSESPKACPLTIFLCAC